MSKKRVLGLDPGLRHTGWGVVDWDGTSLRFIACGTIHPDPTLELPLRLVTLYKGIIQVCTQWTPDTAAVEDTFLNRNPNSSLKLGHARGVVLMTPAFYGIPVAQYASKTVKRAVVGAGGASKEQVQMMVKTLLPTAKIKTLDEADALAIAICHSHYDGTLNKWNALIGAQAS